MSVSTQQGMDKLLLFPGKTEQGIFTYVIDTEHKHLTKTASEYHPKIAEYIKNAETIPGKTQILLTALGAMEYWGCNVNGDAFPEKSLAHEGTDYGHKTFETCANVFKHHVNKDPNAKYGDVALSVYNPQFKRVELIVSIDNDKAPDIVQRIENGEYPDWSMGCRVPYDQCNVCGNKARNPKEYCEHLRYYMGKVDPETGKLAYAINWTPRFFDISMVLIGADRVAKTLKKVASSQSYRPVMGSAFLAEKLSGDKTSSMEKEIPAFEDGEAVPPASQDSIDSLVRAIPEVKAQEDPFPREILDELGKQDFSKVMSTLAMLGILPKPDEFQRIMLINVGRKDLADELDSRNVAFDPMSCPEPSKKHEKILGLSDKKFDPKIMEFLKSFVPDRSYAAPHLANRLSVMVKKSSQEHLPYLVKVSQPGTKTYGDEEKKSPEVEESDPLGLGAMMLAAAGLYSAFSKKAPQMATGKLDKTIAKHPALAASMAAGPAITMQSMAGPKVQGDFDPKRMDENPAVNNMAERVRKKKEKPILKIGEALGPASRRLFAGIPSVYMASGVLQKKREANPYEEEGTIAEFTRKNPDVIGGALALDSMMALHGKGTTQIPKKTIPAARGAWNKAKNLLGKFGQQKLASVGTDDFLSVATDWPLAVGQNDLPDTIVGGLFDQAVLEKSQKLLSKKDRTNRIE